MTELLTAEKWARHGLETLREHGFGALKADILTKSLHVSRGSFYWHFKDVAAYHRAVADLWRRRATEAIIERLNAMSASADRLPTLLRVAFSEGAALDKAMRAWALSSPIAHAAVVEVDAERVRYIEQLLHAANAPRHSVPSRARVLYWAYVGFAMAASTTSEELAPILNELTAFALAGDEGPA